MKYVLLSSLIFLTSFCYAQTVDVERLQERCEAGRIIDCDYLAALYDIGADNLEKSEEKASEYYEKSCNFGSAKACSYLGVRFTLGIGVDQSPEKAAEYLQRGCDSDDDLGCTNLGLLYQLGDGVPQSNEKAKEYYDKACKLGSDLSCKYSEALE